MLKNQCCNENIISYCFLIICYLVSEWGKRIRMFNSNGFASFNITCNKNNFLVISLCRGINQWLEKSRNQSGKLGQLQFSCWWPFTGLTFLSSQYLTLPMIMYCGTSCVYFFIHDMDQKFQTNFKATDAQLCLDRYL